MSNLAGFVFCLAGASLLVLAAAIYAARVFLDSETLGQYREIQGAPFASKLDLDRTPDGKRFLIVALGVLAMSTIFFVQAVLAFLGVYGGGRGAASIATAAATLGFVLGAVDSLLAWLCFRFTHRLSLPPTFFTFSREPVPITTPSDAKVFSIASGVGGLICFVVGVGVVLRF